MLEEGITTKLQNMVLDRLKPLASKLDFQHFPAAAGEVDKFPRELVCLGTELLQEM